MITSVLLFFFYLPVTQMTQRCGSMCSNESHPPSLQFQPSFPSSLYFLLSVVFLLLPVLLVACALVLLLLLDHFQSPAVSANHTVTPLTPLISTALSPPAPPQHPAPQPRSLLPLPVGEERERGWGGGWSAACGASFLSPLVPGYPVCISSGQSDSCQRH